MLMILVFAILLVPNNEFSEFTCYRDIYNNRSMTIIIDKIFNIAHPYHHTTQHQMESKL